MLRMLSDEQIQEIETRLQAATPGPWTVGFNGAMRSGWAVMRANTSRTIFHLDPLKNVDLDEATHQVDADLDLVQYSRTDLEVLLAEVKSLRSSSTKTESDAISPDLQEAQLALMEIAQRCERLQNALEFYADLNNFRPPKPPPGEAPPLWVGNDLGRKAREALGLPEVMPSPETPSASGS